ncbi:hypothetical protein V5F53_20895 [Xanthobacter sp. V4C-4]|uniref:hypothetical protein n=1 Tax=Xanthobacter cornucopiae TaxID=3119924 RepID=UPI00372867AD
MSTGYAGGPLPEHLRPYSLMPFWFWNDALSAAEICRQIADFEQHGVHGFVLHPRIGLPPDLAWMSPRLLDFMGVAIEAARARGMKVILYDEGMYPSGASAGQVVARHPELACRCLRLWPADAAPPGASIVAAFTRPDGARYVVVDAVSGSQIRGLHYADEANAVDGLHPASDILNPRTAEVVIELVYERYRAAFGAHFGDTILGIFTDEPSALGRNRDKTLRPGTTGLLPVVSTILGYDVSRSIDRLWFDDFGDALRFRADYARAIETRLEQTWYRPLADWCARHGLALCGHPARGDQMDVQKYFHIPGQDLVLRRILPNQRGALAGPESTQAKLTSSYMANHGRARNSNEFCGGYGHETTFADVGWLADWCLIRGVNMLIPHAFYYSVRGVRRDERPPQVGGVGCSWWAEFAPFAHHCALLSWLNAGTHLCEVAVLTDGQACSWVAAEQLYRAQIDFNYITAADVAAGAAADGHLGIAGMRYRLVIIDGLDALADETRAKLAPLAAAGRVLALRTRDGGVLDLPGVRSKRRPEDLPRLARAILGSPFTGLSNVPGLRVRAVRQDGATHLLFFNEDEPPLAATFTYGAHARGAWIASTTGAGTAAAAPFRLDLQGRQTAILRLED